LADSARFLRLAGFRRTLSGYSARGPPVSDSHQFIEERLIVVCYPEDLLLILFGQGAALLKQDAMRATLPTVNCISNSVNFVQHFIGGTSAVRVPVCAQRTAAVPDLEYGPITRREVWAPP
jgi:hypothetical protein